MFRYGIRTQLLDVIGEGGHGRVFKALRIDRQTRLTQTVAIKILHSETAVELWQKEFQSLSRVRSPYCVQVLAFERISRRPALVLEYIEGLSLNEIGRLGLLTPSEIDEVVDQIEAGLNDLRAQQICHGDLSPANVMVDTTGHVRLLDFGLANQARATYEYSAPERLAGHSADFASDLFALGRIEQFLKRTPATDVNSTYLNLEPTARRGRGRAPDLRLQPQIGQKVKNHLKRGGEATQSLEVMAPVSRRYLGARVLALSIFCAFLGATRATPPPQPLGVGRLRLVTVAWCSFALDGVNLGFAPIDMAVRAGAHTLRFRCAKGKGERSISITAGRAAELSDRDFKQLR